MNKNILYSIVLVWSLLLWSGCSSEELSGGETEPADGKVELSFRLSVPDPEVQAVQTRAQTAAETTISTADVLVFTKKEGATDYTYDYHVQGAMQQTGNPTSGFKARIKSTPLPVKIYVLANASLSAGQITEPTVGQTEEMVKQNLTTSLTPSANMNNIPMWGEHTAAGGIAAAYNKEIIGIKMYRALAKATVTVEAALAARFAITNLYLARSRSKIGLVPGAVDAAGMIVSPRVPAHAPNEILGPIQFATGTLLYLPEDEGWGTAAEMAAGTQSKTNTCIIVAGQLDGGTVSYYRVDVRQDNIYGRIIRNHHYQITLSGITKAGTATLQQALDLTTPSMTYEVNSFNLSAGLTTIHFDNIEQLSAAEQQILLMPDAYTRDIPINPGEINTGVQVARYSGGAIDGSFGPAASLPAMSGTATIALQGGAPVLRITTAANAGATDIREQLMLKTPTKMLLLDVIKKSPATVGVSAVVEGATNPQRAEFLATGGTKTVTVASSSDWQVEGVPNWISARKLSSTELQLSIATNVQADRAREHTLTIRNQTGQTAQIIAYQQYRLEWSNAYSRGGEHLTTLIYRYQMSGAPYTINFAPATPAGTPVGFAAQAGDVNYLTNRVTGYNPSDALNHLGRPYLFTTNPANTAMLGDYYLYAQALNACPAGWRLPTYSETETLINNLQVSANKTLYLTQNGTNIYFPRMSFVVIVLNMYIDSGSLNYVADTGWFFKAHIPIADYADTRHTPTPKIVPALFYATDPAVHYSYVVRCVR